MLEKGQGLSPSDQDTVLRMMSYEGDLEVQKGTKLESWEANQKSVNSLL